MMRIATETVILGAPWSWHSSGFRSKVAQTGGTIATVDGGLLECETSGWKILRAGDFNDTDAVLRYLQPS
ncbi:hypothetical protein NKJ66_01115 [Mesorhizobium sp. M0078]|uniref:hypothetical protein n=1 Tax=Mesorhizobium sp. M0078 TaxID=2956871 RepID=UPI00333AB80D